MHSKSAEAKSVDASTGAERIRQLERRFQQSGTSADEAHLLVERLREGSLTRERLLVAALVGSEGAAAALGDGDRLQPLKEISWLIDQDWTRRKGCPKTKAGG